MLRLNRTPAEARTRAYWFAPSRAPGRKRQRNTTKPRKSQTQQALPSLSPVRQRGIPHNDSFGGLILGFELRRTLGEEFIRSIGIVKQMNRFTASVEHWL